MEDKRFFLIHPIDYRYGSYEMRKIFDRENWLQKMLEVEAALAKAHAEVGNIPRKAAEHISKMATIEHVKLERVNEIEKEIKHETMAVIKALTEVCGPYGKYIHLGATSSDILDTVLALQIKEAINIIEKDLIEIAHLLIDLAEKNKETICVGRTHGQHAIPYILGHKFAIWANEIKLHIERLRQCKERVCVGKMSGAVGTQAGFGPNALKVQELTMKYLGIKPAEISSQIVPRDRLAEFICLLALISSSLDKFGREIRNLQRTEIHELEEPFKEEVQVGSSTMPQKRNPISSEKICGLAKILRSLAVAALENVVIEHERDLTNSSCERTMVPEACILLDEQLKTMKKVLKGLRIYPENMKRNLNLTKGLIMAEAVMLTLVKKGIGRQEAHEIIRRCAMKAYKNNIDFFDALKTDKTVQNYLTEEEIKQALNPYNYTGTAKTQIENIIKQVKNYLQTAK